MPFLVMFENNMFLTSTSDIKLSKKIASAKKWNNPDLAKKAINKLMEKGKDINGLNIYSIHKAKTFLSSMTEQKNEEQPKRKRGRPRKNPIPIVENVDNSEKEVYNIPDEVKEIESEPPIEIDAVKEEKKYEYGDLAQDFSGINKFCLNCVKECKQKFIDVIVYCPMFHEKRSA